MQSLILQRVQTFKVPKAVISFGNKIRRLVQKRLLLWISIATLLSLVLVLGSVFNISSIYSNFQTNTFRQFQLQGDTKTLRRDDVFFTTAAMIHALTGDRQWRIDDEAAVPTSRNLSK
jgi:cell division septal protein FtsQ